jgi:hypothetical protein
MRRISLFSTAAMLAVTALSASTPAKADPFHLIRWMDTGFCQIWDESIPTVPTSPWPAHFVVVSATMPTFLDVLTIKGNMLATGACSF